MTKFNTLLRVVYTLVVYLSVTAAASAQSVLNFPKATINGQSDAGFGVINPTSNYADVQFTFYGLDGNPVSAGLMNPVRYRVAPKGQLSMRASDIFAGADMDGWVQATSPVQGLTGTYLLGDFATMLEGAAPPESFAIQVIPLIREDSVNHTELNVVNPGSETGNLTITFYNPRGDEIGTTTHSLNAHAVLRLRVSSLLPNRPSENLSAKISSSIPVSAMAFIERWNAMLIAAGQPVEQQAAVRVAPHFISGNGFDPVLILKNPNGSPVPVTVTLYGENGGAPSPQLEGPASRTFTIPGNGSVSLNTVDILGRLIFTLSINGWLRVDSANAALNSLLILDQGPSVTGIPLETVPMSRSIYAHPYQDDFPSQVSGISLVNPASVAADVSMVLVAEDGASVIRNTVRIPPASKVSKLVRDVFPEYTGRTNGYIYVQSSEPLYGIRMMAAGALLASVSPNRIPATFLPNSIAATPAILRIDPGTEVVPGTTLYVSVTSLENVVFTVAGQAVASRQLAPGVPIFVLDVPGIEPGFANLRVRSNGLDSAPVVLHILPADNSPYQNVVGRAFYQKTDLKDSGLDLNNPVMVPIRSARVELIDKTSQAIVAVSETDSSGQFVMPVPANPNLSIRIISRLRSSNLRVADNTNLNAIYAASADIDGRNPPAELLLTDRSRSAGAFNILEVIQRANETVKMADPLLTLPPVSVFWSIRNTNRYGNPVLGQIGTSMFNVATNTAYMLGDRSADSDEFDDPVIVHEYAHMLAAKFSRDDSPGGPHVLGDMLDARVAWSEGWANFFSSAVRNDPIWRDSGPNGALIVRYDLEDNVPAGDRPGYWSEASVDTILWDLFDDREDPADDVRYPISEIWNAFTDLRNHQFVYLPYFLEHFLARNPAAADVVRVMVQSRSIDFKPNVLPSVTNPFPTPMNAGNSVTGFVDSLTTKRSNLVGSSHFYSFTTTGGAASIRLDVAGFGPGGNPNANDLDLFLMDENGRVIDKSDSGLNGQSERIATRLSAGAYIVEIRSFYTKAETGGFIFNSGQYRLSVSVQ